MNTKDKYRWCGLNSTEKHLENKIMSKQTAVEWLFEQISNSLYYYKLIEDIERKGTIRKPKNIFQQAKEMEDQQLLEYWNGNSEV